MSWCSDAQRMRRFPCLQDCLLTLTCHLARDTMSTRESGSRLTSESCPTRENTSSTLVSEARWDTVYLKTKKCKGNRTRKCHIISNSLSTPSSTQTNRWHSSSETLDHLRISSVTASNSAGSVISDSWGSRALAPRNILLVPDNFFFFCWPGDIWRVDNFTTSFASRMYVLYKVSAVMYCFSSTFWASMPGCFDIYTVEPSANSIFFCRNNSLEVPVAWLHVLDGWNPPAPQSPSVLLSAPDHWTWVTPADASPPTLHPCDNSSLWGHTKTWDFEHPCNFLVFNWFLWIRVFALGF